MKKFFIYFITTFFLIIFTSPVFAYAGPGAAIGAIIVFLTIIITFFASFLITIFTNLKKFLNQIKIFYKSKKIKNKKYKK